MPSVCNFAYAFPIRIRAATATQCVTCESREKGKPRRCPSRLGTRPVRASRSGAPHPPVRQHRSAMAYSYMFFKPKRLPLQACQLGEDTVEPIIDLGEAQATLARVFPHLNWSSNGWARGETEHGKWLEFAIPDGGTLFMRCSFRADYSAEVQRICDASGWIAVDQDPKVFMPYAARVNV